MYLVINKCVIAVKVSNFSGQYLRNHWTLDIGVLGYIVIVWPKEHSPKVRSFPPGTPCISSSGMTNVWDTDEGFLAYVYTSEPSGSVCSASAKWSPLLFCHTIGLLFSVVKKKSNSPQLNVDWFFIQVGRECVFWEPRTEFLYVT